jgi:hypothetical protein
MKFASAVLLLAFVFGAPARADVETEVTSTVQAMAARWNAGQRHTIAKDFWDASDPKVMYLAGEQPDWFVGLPAIEAYLAIRPNAPPTISSFVVTDIRVRPVAADVAMAVWNLDYQFQRGTLPAMRERLRASAMLRKTNGGWKFFVYTESPKSSMTYLRDLYEAIVTPEFKAKVDVAKPKE